MPFRLYKDQKSAHPCTWQTILFDSFTGYMWQIPREHHAQLRLPLISATPLWSLWNERLSRSPTGVPAGTYQDAVRCIVCQFDGRAGTSQSFLRLPTPPLNTHNPTQCELPSPLQQCHCAQWDAPSCLVVLYPHTKLIALPNTEILHNSC